VFISRALIGLKADVGKPAPSGAKSNDKQAALHGDADASLPHLFLGARLHQRLALLPWLRDQHERAHPTDTSAFDKKTALPRLYSEMQLLCNLRRQALEETGALSGSLALRLKRLPLSSLATPLCSCEFASRYVNIMVGTDVW